MVVAAHHHVEHSFALHRSRDNYLADPTVEVRVEQLAGAELSGGLDDDLDSELVPRHRTRRGVLGERHPRPVDDQRAPATATLPVAAVDRVELEEVCGRLDTALVLVDVNELRSGWWRKARTARRPMRPKPLMPIRVVIVGSVQGGRRPR